MWLVRGACPLAAMRMARSKSRPKRTARRRSSNSPTGSIEMEITETVNGKETTKKHSAKNYDELKMKDAEAAKIYDQ